MYVFTNEIVGLILRRRSRRRRSAVRNREEIGRLIKSGSDLRFQARTAYCFDSNQAIYFHFGMPGGEMSLVTEDN